jgi:glycosyltransferase involved in cell wall biosynthesis
MGRPRILHLHSTFAAGGKETRDVRLMNHWGDALEHVILSAVPGRMEAADLIAPGVPWRRGESAPPLAGAPSPARVRALGRWIAAQGFDLVLSFNWGALDGALAARWLAGRPVIHHEDGFNEDERDRQRPARRLLRRLALPSMSAVVVPSLTLERIARATWGLSPPRLVRIPNGIDVDALAVPPAPDAIPGLVRRPGELVVGTLAGLRRIKNLPRLVRAFAAATAQGGVPRAWLVIVGDGPEAGAIRAEAVRLGVEDRLVMPGFLPDPHRYVGLFDIFALSSDSEQFPISQVEAMAAGLPVVMPAVGDVAWIAAAPNRPWIVPPGDEAALAAALAAALRNPAARAAVGAANRAKARAEYSFAAMVAAYERTYGAVLGARSPWRMATAS